MISKNWYRRYKILLSSTPLFSRYIRKIYRVTKADMHLSDMMPDVNKASCTAFLCGTAGEITSQLFLQHVQSMHDDPKVIILDIGEDQVKSSQEAIEKNFPDADVEFIIADARNTGISFGSVDFIDTDFMFEYLDTEGIEDVLREWKRILAPGGIIAFRVFGYQSGLGKLVMQIGDWIFAKMLQSDVYAHSISEVEDALEKVGFRYVRAGRALGVGWRYIGKVEDILE